MKFTYLKKKFLNEHMNLWSNGDVHIEVGDNELILKNWDEVRELMYKMEDINKEAALTKRRQHYGKDLYLYLDDGVWTLWWKGQIFPIGGILLRQLPVVLRYFVKKYNKIMLDYNSCLLHEGFEIETGNSYSNAYSSTGDL